MSYTNLVYHIVFSTKERRPFMASDILPRICRYLAGVACNHGATPLVVNGMPDHLHVATIIAPTITVSDFVCLVKTNTSRWIHETFSDLGSFSWQEGYSAFTVSRSATDSVIADDVDFDRDYWRNTKPQFDHCGAIALPYRKARPISPGVRKDIAGN